MSFDAKLYWFQQGLVIILVIGAKCSKGRYVKWGGVDLEDFKTSSVVEIKKNVGMVGVVFER